MNDHNPSGNWDGSDDSGPMTDRPTGPATTAGRFLLAHLTSPPGDDAINARKAILAIEAEAEHIGYVKGQDNLSVRWVTEHEAETKARILAALPEALSIAISEIGARSPWLLHRVEGEPAEDRPLAAALAAALEKLI